jgi:hypothetical protein
MMLSKEVLKLLLNIAEENFVCISFHKLMLKVKIKISLQHKIQESKIFVPLSSRTYGVVSALVLVDTVAVISLL